MAPNPKRAAARGRRTDGRAAQSQAAKAGNVEAAAAVLGQAMPPEFMAAQAGASQCWFDAIMFAVSSDCDCRACDRLRAQSEILGSDGKGQQPAAG